MKINELRIGNLIQEGKVEQIDNSIDEIYYYGDGYYLSNYCCNIKPIPLTEEWLLNFGFTKELDCFFRKNKSQLIEVLFCDSGIQFCTQSVCLNHLKYVHQLQNLYFALTNKELTL